MNFDVDEKESSLVKSVEKAVDQDADKKLKALQTEGPLKCRKLFRDYLGRLAKTGYLALGVESGKNSTALVAAQETLAAVSPSLFLAVESSTRLFGRLVVAYATAEQKNEIVPLVRQGGYVGCVALTEGGMSVENEPFNTTASPSGNDAIITGTKDHVINAPLADRVAVIVRFHENILVALIHSDSPGVAMGDRLRTVGYEGTPVASIHFDHVRVPESDVMGSFDGPSVLKDLRRWEDQVLTGASLGLLKRSYQAALDHAKKHARGGKPILARQEVGFKLAEMLTIRQTAQLLAYRAAWMDDSGNRERDTLIHCAKVFCAESAELVASQALQILGAKGLIKGNPAEESYGSAKYLQIAGTSSEISRIKIGDHILERA